jgi:hypothetical protein
MSLRAIELLRYQDTASQPGIRPNFGKASVRLIGHTHSRRQPEARKGIYRDPPELDSRESQRSGHPKGTRIG